MALIDLFQFFVHYDRDAYEVFFPANAAATEADVQAFALGLGLPEEFRVYLTTPIAGLTVTARRSRRSLHVFSLAEVRAMLANFPGLVPFLERDGVVFCFEAQGKVVGAPAVDFADLVLGLLQEP
jgi:hypothetical protein